MSVDTLVTHPLDNTLMADTSRKKDQTLPLTPFSFQGEGVGRVSVPA